MKMSKQRKLKPSKELGFFCGEKEPWGGSQTTCTIVAVLTDRDSHVPVNWRLSGSLGTVLTDRDGHAPVNWRLSHSLGAVLTETAMHQ